MEPCDPLGRGDSDCDCEDVDDEDALVVGDILGVRVVLGLSDCDGDDVDVGEPELDWLSDCDALEEEVEV